MSGKRAARPAKQEVRRRRLLGLVAALVVLGVVGAVAWALGASRDAGGESSTPSATTARDSASPDQQPTSGEAADAKSISACAADVARASSAVEAAAPGVSHWSSHVQARTDMLQGRIPVTTMDAIWRRTRLVGPADQTRFRTALDSYDSTSNCARLRDGSGSSSDPTARCRARSEAAKHAVAAAGAAMRDWQSHLANMSVYARHQMSQKTAQGRWVSAWRNAPAHISAFRSARDALDEAPPCKDAG